MGRLAVLEAFPDALEVFVKRAIVLLPCACVVALLFGLFLFSTSVGMALALLAAMLLASLWYVAICNVVVKDYREGLGRISISEAAIEAIRDVPRFLGAMIVITVVYALIVFAYLFGLVIVGLSAVTGPREMAIASLIGLVIVVLLVAITLIVRWFLIGPAIVIENWPTSSLARSSALVRGSGFQFALLYLLISLFSAPPFAVAFSVVGQALIYGFVGMTLWGLLPAVGYYKVKELRAPATAGWAEVSVAATPVAVDPQLAGSVPPPSVAPPTAPAPSAPAPPVPPPPPRSQRIRS